MNEYDYPYSRQSIYDSMYKLWQLETGIRVGDIVKVLRKAKDNELGWRNSWELQMDSTVGEEFVAKRIAGDGVKLSNGFYYPFYVLEVIKPNSEVVELNDEYVAEVTADHIKVGCQIFPASVLVKLVEAHDKITGEAK